MTLRALLLSLFCLTALPLIAGPARAGEMVTYKDGDTELEGYFARTKAPAPAPVVLIVHQWMGLTDYEKHRADMLAEQGYNAFAVDMYGKGVRPKDKAEAGKMAGLYKGDPDLARRRVHAAIALVQSMSSVGPEIAIFGYCFGGTMALEAARAGEPLAAVVSFHGGLATKAPAEPGAIKAPIQVHHGADDPNVSPPEVAAFKEEMKNAGATMEFFAYPGAVHSFTQKDAGSDNSTGAAYNAEADKTSWSRSLDFLKKSFAAAKSAGK